MMALSENSEIKNMLICRSFNIPIENLRDPPAYLRVREVKDWYVDFLTTLLLNEDAEDLTAPFMVKASVSPSELRAQKLNTYTYEVYTCTIVHWSFPSHSLLAYDGRHFSHIDKAQEIFLHFCQSFTSC